MSSEENQTDLVAALAALTERLSAPELTLCEARGLRAELAKLLERIRLEMPRPARTPPATAASVRFPFARLTAMSPDWCFWGAAG